MSSDTSPLPEPYALENGPCRTPIRTHLRSQLNDLVDGGGEDILRDTERVDIGSLPVIFQDVQEEEYKLLSPLSAKMHIAATKRQMTYLKPDQFKNATEEDWKAHFSEPMRTGRVPGETLDFFILCPLAEEAEKEKKKKSAHQDIVKYILDQM